MTKFNIREKTNNLLVFFVWFTPILGTSLYSRFYYYQLDVSLIKALIIISIIVGVFSLIRCKTIGLNTNVLAAIMIIYLLALISDPLKYSTVIFAMSYALLIHFLCINKYQLILSQYLWTCKLIALLAFVDFASFFILGDFLISWREPSVNMYLPRSQTIFDEPSHQVFYLLPALIYHIKLYLENRVRMRLMIVYLFPFLITVSATAAISLTLVATYFIIKMTGKWRLKIFIALSVFIFYYIFFDQIFFKINNIFYPEYFNDPRHGVQSSAVYLMILDVMNSASVMNYLFGVGYYNTGEELVKYLDDAYLMDYYIRTGIFDERVNKWGVRNTGFVGNGASRILFGYGIIVLSIISFLIYKSKKNISGNYLSSFIVFSLFIMWLKAPQVIASPLAIFFLFGLYQAKENIRIRLNMK